jgi:hypothetical protein
MSILFWFLVGRKAPEMLSPSIEDMNAFPYGFAPKLVH